MIANSCTNKLKASKGFRETDGVRLFDSEEKVKAFEKGEGDKERVTSEYHNKHSSHSVNSIKERYDRSKPRSRNRDDFRMVRGSHGDRRGSGPRGRGGTHRKSERENESGYISRGKFQEPLSKGKSCDGIISISSTGKYINEADSGKTKSGRFLN